FRYANLSHDSLLGKLTQRAPHHISLDRELPDSFATRTLQFSHQSVLAGVIFQQDIAHEIRLPIDNLVRADLHLSRIRRIDRDVIDDVFVVACTDLSDANRFAAPITD